MDFNKLLERRKVEKPPHGTPPAEVAAPLSFYGTPALLMEVEDVTNAQTTGYLGISREPAPDASPAPDQEIPPAELAVREIVAERAAEAAEPDPVERPDYPPDEPQWMYLAGTAGTGKSWLARQRAEDYSDAILTASTGIAAVNIGGTTINSVLAYYDTGDLQTSYELGRLNVRLKNMARSGYRRLLVDEVSMMDGRQLDILTLAFDEINEWLAAAPDFRDDAERRPMGITLVGDFAQLPPVNAPFVFERPSWERFEAHTTMLTEPRRQADADFVRALQAVRRGDSKAAIEYFGQFIKPAEDRRFDGTTILAKNDEVDRYNKIRMLELPPPEETYKALRVGEQSGEWKNIPDLLTLKPNALVMILANKYEGPPDARELIYANGDLAHYLAKVNDGMARCRLQRTGAEVIVRTVTREKKTPTGAKGVKKDRDEKNGSVSYMPLRVAYASTVHKSQGLSLDNVQIMMHSHFWTSPGMAYVALSRARTPAGLRIVCTPEQFQTRVKVNPLIRKWL